MKLRQILSDYSNGDRVTETLGERRVMPIAPWESLSSNAASCNRNRAGTSMTWVYLKGNCSGIPAWRRTPSE